MLSLKCTLIISIFCGTVFPNTAHSIEGSSNVIREQSDLFSKENSSISSNKNFTQNGKLEYSLQNLIIENSAKFNKSESLKFFDEKPKNRKGSENETFNNILPLFPFPLVPFLFPAKKTQERFDGSFDSSETFSPRKDENESKSDISLLDAKPFVFFKYALNIRQIPLANKTESKVVKLKAENLKKQKEDFRRKSQKNRKKRNAVSKREKMGYLDDFSLLSDSDADEFFPKAESIFPDLFQMHKPLRKLSRKKRDAKKRNVSLVDVFNDAFTKIQNEFEESNPFLRFFPENDKTILNDFFGDSIIPKHSERKPKDNWRTQRNAKRFKDNYNNGYSRARDSPVIIVDKIMKIGEFHLNDDEIMKGDNKRKKEGKPVKRKETFEEKLEPSGLNNLQSFFNLRSGPLQNTYPNEGFHSKVSRNSNKSFAKVQSKEIKILPQSDTSVITVGNNTTIELKKKNVQDKDKASNYTGTEINYAGSLLKIMESLKAKAEEEDDWKVNTTNAERVVERVTSGQYNQDTRQPLYEDLEKNISKVLNQFLTMFKYLNDVKLESNENGSFDWTENETLEESNFLPKKRTKKNIEFLQNDIDFYDDDDRQIADLYYLFLVITLPTLIGFALLFFLCFISFQVKGALCTRLFKPRHVYVYEETMKFNVDEEEGQKKDVQSVKQGVVKKEDRKITYEKESSKVTYEKEPPTYNKPSEELKTPPAPEQKVSKCHRKKVKNEADQQQV